MADMLNRKALLGSLGQGEDADTAVEPFKAEGLRPGEDAPNTSPAPALDPVLASPTGPADAPKAEDYTKLGQFANRMGNWSTDAANPSEKFAVPWDQRSDRYKTLTVQSHFDPNQGVTPEMIAALNAAHINGATYSGGKDKLGAHGLQNWENYDGREGLGDVIQGFNDPNNTNKQWNAWSPENAGPASGNGGSAMGGLPPELGGDPMAAIQAALAKYQGKSPNIEALLAQLGGGQ